MSNPRSAVGQFFRSSAMMAILYAGATCFTFLVGVVLTRSLGVSGYGVYSLAMTSATLVGMATEFGLPMLAMREVGAARASDDWSALRGLLQWSDRVILGLSLALIVSTYVGHQLFAQDRTSPYLATMLWAVVLVPVVAIGKLRSFVLLALDHVFSSQFSVMILRPTLFLIGCLLLWRFGEKFGPVEAMVAQVGGAAIVMAIILIQFRLVRPPALAAARPVSHVNAWLKACLPMGLSEGMRLLQSQLGLLLVGALAGTTQAGLYRVADAVNTITMLVASVVWLVATPMFGRLWSSGDRVGLDRVVLLSAWAMFGGAIAVGLPIALFGYMVFPFFFGASFATSVPIFLILWCGWVITASFGMCLQLANMTGRHLLATQSFVVIALLNAAVSIVAVPAWGAMGGALATVTGNIAGSAFCTWRLYREHGFNPTVFNRSGLALLRDAVLARLRSLRRNDAQETESS